MGTPNVKKGQYIYIDDTPLIIPIDQQYRPVSVLYGLAPDLEKPFIPIKVDNEGRLVIDFQASQITLGAVEIKDSLTNIRLNVVTPGYPSTNPIAGITLYGIKDSSLSMDTLHLDSAGNLKVTVVNPITISSSFLEYDSKTNVAGNSEYTILTYTNSGSVLWLDGWSASGTALGVFSFYVNTDRKMVLRAGSSLTVQHNFPVPFKVNNGDILSIKVLHKMPKGNFDASLLGHRS